MSRGMLAILVVGIGLLAGFALLPQATAVHGDDDETHEGRKLEDTTQLTVRGQAELQKPADEAVLSVGVTSEGADAGDTLNDNSRRMTDIVDAIERVGLTDDEYETGRFRIRPQYSRRPRQPEPDWQPQIIGYEVVNTITIETKQLDLVAKTIEAANKAGANTVEVKGFQLSEPRQFRPEAIREATKNAREDAAILADAADLDLVRIISINLDNTPVARPMAGGYAAARMSADVAVGPPVVPGEVTVTANVTIIYEIAPKH